jgi:hypothetical protein
MVSATEEMAMALPIEPRRLEPLAARLGLGPEEAAELEALRRDWHARIAPIDAAERAAADAVVLCVWRRQRLDRVEERVLRGLLEGGVEPGLPALGTLQRMRGRLERDRQAAEQEMILLRDSRPAEIPVPSLNPERLEWLARKLRDGSLRGRAAQPAATPAAAAVDAGGAPPPPAMHVGTMAAAAAPA